VKVSDDASVRLVCLDTVSGQIRGTKSFTTNNNDFPVNLALSADGTLVYTLPTRLVLKDLYKPWDAADSERNAAAGGVVPSDSTNPMPFRNASGPDQLIISEGRILALADMGSGQLNDHNGFGGTKYVRLHSLETGQAITLKVSDKKGDLTDMIIYAETGPPRSWDIHLHAVGSRLYIRNSIGVLCYDLDRPKEFWQQPSQDAIDQVSGTVRDMFIGKDHAVTLSQLGPGENGDGDVAPPAAAPAQPRKPRPSKWQLTAYARYPGQAGGTAESGRTDYVPVITESAAITQWQGVTGGFYYLTQDGKLHYLTAVQ
jgi:hypothetical protein